MSQVTDLFMKDPLKMTKEDLDAIIAHMRERRAAYKSNPAAVKATKTLTAAQKAVSGLNIELDI